MSACSPRSAVSASTADTVELEKACRVDPPSGSWTPGGEGFARILQSEREYWRRLCRQQVGEVERALQERVEGLESRAVERARESLRPSIDEALSELHGEISRSLHQELEVQRAERDAAALQAQRDCRAQAEAALRAAREEIEARCSARLDAMQAELQEQRQQIAALSERLEGLERQRPERVQACTSGDRARTAAAKHTWAQPRSASLAPRGELPELATTILHKVPAGLATNSSLASGQARPAGVASGVSFQAPPVAGPPAALPSAGAELPTLPRRGRAQSRHRAAGPKSTAGPAGTEGGAIPDVLKESLQQVVSAVQRTLDDFEDQDPQQGAPGPTEQAPVTSRSLAAPPAQAAAAPHRAPAQQPWGTQAVLAAPVSPLLVHRALQVLVPAPRAITPRGTGARGCGAAPVAER